MKVLEGVKAGFFVKGTRTDTHTGVTSPAELGPYDTCEVAEGVIVDMICQGAPTIIYVLYIEKHYMPDLVCRKGGDADDRTR